MRTIKNLLPIIILLALSSYVYHIYPRLTQTILNGIVFLPVTLTFMILALSVHFNRSTIFFYAVLIALTNVVLGQELAATNTAYASLSILLPLTLLLLSVMPERGILSLRAIPAYVVLAFAITIFLIMTKTSPEWAIHLVLNDWLPVRYFDWTQQSQSVLLVSFTVLIAMLVLFFVQPSPNTSTGLGVSILLITQLHFGYTDPSLTVFSSMALLMCLYAVLQESWRMAYLDELTELPARRALREKFQKMGGLYTVAMLDVDHFKKFNDNYGHDTGDAVLRMIANKMNKVTGGGVSYRYGGEEFTIVFTGKSSADTKSHLENLRESIADTPFVINRASRRKSDKKVKRTKNKSVKVTVSIGVADSTSDASTPWDVLKLSDKALYRAKGKGRNCVCA